MEALDFVAELHYNQWHGGTPNGEERAGGSALGLRHPRHTSAAGRVAMHCRVCEEPLVKNGLHYEDLSGRSTCYTILEDGIETYIEHVPKEAEE